MKTVDISIIYLMKGHAGTTYIRWGRTSCSGKETDLVYSGKIKYMYCQSKYNAWTSKFSLQRINQFHLLGILSDAKVGYFIRWFFLHLSSLEIQEIYFRCHDDDQ